MAIYASKIGGLDNEITDPTEGMKGYNSRGQRVVYDARAGKWVMPQSYVAPGESQPQQVTITGNGQVYTPTGVYAQDEQGNATGDAMTIDEANAARDEEQAAHWADTLAQYGATVTYANGQYTITDANGQVYRTNSPSQFLPDIRAAAGESPTTSNPWYEGDDGPGGTPGPLTVTPEYPDGGPIPGGNGFLPFMPTDPGGGMGPIGGGGGGMFNPGDNVNVPGGGGGGGDPWTPGPPEGIPLNPIVKQNEMVFSPYGQGAARFSDTLTFGGLPRSTGPWNTPGGYYGGNPYDQMPAGYEPPAQPGGGTSISPGGNLPTNPIPGTTLPPNPWSPAGPADWGNKEPTDDVGFSPEPSDPTAPGGTTTPGGGTSKPGETPNVPHDLTPEQKAAYTYYLTKGLTGDIAGVNK